MEKKKTKPRMKRKARRIYFHVTPEVKRTNRDIIQNGNRKRISQKAKVENRKHA